MRLLLTLLFLFTFQCPFWKFPLWLFLLSFNWNQFLSTLFCLNGDVPLNYCKTTCSFLLISVNNSVIMSTRFVSNFQHSIQYSIKSTFSFNLKSMFNLLINPSFLIVNFKLSSLVSCNVAYNFHSKTDYSEQEMTIAKFLSSEYMLQ